MSQQMNDDCNARPNPSIRLHQLNRRITRLRVQLRKPNKEVPLAKALIHDIATSQSTKPTYPTPAIGTVPVINNRGELGVWVFVLAHTQKLHPEGKKDKGARKAVASENQWHLVGVDPLDRERGI